MPYIKRVMPLENYRLFLEMETGSTVTVELKSKLETVRFGELSDRNLFQTATTDGDFVIWQDGHYTLKVSVKELLDVVMADRKNHPGQPGYGMGSDK